MMDIGRPCQLSPCFFNKIISTRLSKLDKTCDDDVSSDYIDDYNDNDGNYNNLHLASGPTK